MIKRFYFFVCILNPVPNLRQIDFCDCDKNVTENINLTILISVVYKLN